MTFQNLVCLVKAGKIGDKQRPYKVTSHGKTEYVISNSPGNAALEICAVETVTQKQLLDATLEALNEQKAETKKTA